MNITHFNQVRSYAFCAAIGLVSGFTVALLSNSRLRHFMWDGGQSVITAFWSRFAIVCKEGDEKVVAVVANAIQDSSEKIPEMISEDSSCEIVTESKSPEITSLESSTEDWTQLSSSQILVEGV